MFVETNHVDGIKDSYHLKTTSYYLDNDFLEILFQYLSHECFIGRSLFPETPYDRPIRKQDINIDFFSTPVTIDEIFSNKNLLLNKILLTIYEQDLLFLGPRFKEQFIERKFYAFYSPSFVALGKLLKPKLEYLAFNFLKNEIEVIGNWDKNKLFDYLHNTIKTQENQENKLCCFIESCNHPLRGLKMLLVQMAPDFLSEASAMARLLPGSFGEEQSELMKIFIDEYGYGVHETKHSRLFENTLESVKLSKEIHYYYDSYLPTSLTLTNYFHYLCSNKANWFKYLGALYYTEGTIPHFNKQISILLKKNCGYEVSTCYFDEHSHIDIHHRKMVFDKLIAKSIENYGEKVNNDILFGFQSFKFLQEISEQDLLEQINFNEKELNEYHFQAVRKEKLFEEIKGDITAAHIHSEDELFLVKNGIVEFHMNGIEPRILKSGEKIIIPKGRLHSTVIVSDRASYAIQPIILENN